MSWIAFLLAAFMVIGLGGFRRGSRHLTAAVVAAATLLYVYTGLGH